MRFGIVVYKVKDSRLYIIKIERIKLYSMTFRFAEYTVKESRLYTDWKNTTLFYEIWEGGVYKVKDSRLYIIKIERIKLYSMTFRFAEYTVKESRLYTDWKNTTLFYEIWVGGVYKVKELRLKIIKTERIHLCSMTFGPVEYKMQES